MRSLKLIGNFPASLPLDADEIVEFHLARLLCLLQICGVSGHIDGLTKFAKLDFFSRYPDFFEVAQESTNSPANKATISTNNTYHSVESAMIRHHYGPWDKRYYHALAHMESKSLILIIKKPRSYQITLTNLGRESAVRLIDCESFQGLVAHMREVKSAFGSKGGTYLKNLIYKVFDEEVGRRPMGEKITL